VAEDHKHLGGAVFPITVALTSAVARETDRLGVPEITRCRAGAGQAGLSGEAAVISARGSGRSVTTITTDYLEHGSTLPNQRANAGS
jgi:hypothetical protein